MLPATLSHAAASVLLAVGQALAPAPEMRISEWVDQGHVILNEETQTPKPGVFTFDGVEYLREPLDRLHPDDPAERVTIIGGAQSAKSSGGQLWVCWSIANNPKSFAIGLPSDGEVGKYNDLKLQPLFDASPLLTPRVRPISTKASEGSSVRRKKLFNGANVRIFNLGSVKELQMVSAGNLILEEITNAPKDVGGRGSPVKQARERQAAYSVIGSKELICSTPGILGECIVTVEYEAGDQRLYYGECPHCLGHFTLRPETFKHSDPSWGHHFICPSCGVALEQKHRAAFIKNGMWLATFKSATPEPNPPPPAYVAKADLQYWRNRDVEGRQPSYYVWQAMCGFISWHKIATTIREAKTPEDLKALEQQVFGRAYDASVESLGWEELHRLREDYDHGTVPTGAGVLTGMCDVQGPYLQWAVYAWGPGAEWWVIDRGIITGDTAGDGPWLELDQVTRKIYPHADGGTLEIAAFGVDTGYRTQRAYAFCRARPNTYALDGRTGWKHPFLGKPKAVRVIENKRQVGRVKLWPTGTWELKSLLHWSLKLSIEAKYKVRVQGRGHWSKNEGESYAQEMTSEVLREEKNARTLQIDRYWIKVRKNEELDIWVGARALAWQLGVGAPARDGVGEKFDWKAKAALRGSTAQADFFAPRTLTPAVLSVGNVATSAKRGKKNSLFRAVKPMNANTPVNR